MQNAKTGRILRSAFDIQHSCLVFQPPANDGWYGPGRTMRLLRLWKRILVIIGGALLVGCAEAGAPSVGSEETAPATSESAPPADAAVSSPEPATVADFFPQGAGRELVLSTCGSCHAVACSAIGQRTSARWDALKVDHRDKVSSTSAQDLDSIFAYLKTNFNDARPEPRLPPHFLEGGCTPF